MYKEDPNGRDVRRSQARGAEDLAKLGSLQAEGKVVDDDVTEFKVQMEEEVRERDPDRAPLPHFYSFHIRRRYSTPRSGARTTPRSRARATPPSTGAAFTSATSSLSHRSSWQNTSRRSTACTRTTILPGRR